MAGHGCLGAIPGVALAALLLVAGAGDARAQKPGEAPGAALEAALGGEVNRVRRAAGVDEVARDPGFEAIARGHADDMAARGYMAHVTPEGLRPRDRLTLRFPDYTGVLGENLALRSHRPGETPAETARAAVAAWLDSPPHRATLLNARHTHAGLAAASGPLALYVVLLMGSESTLAARLEGRPEAQMPKALTRSLPPLP